MTAARISAFLAALTGLAAMLVFGPAAAAQQPVPAPPSPSGSAVSPPPSPPAVTADVSGFRSARFGMTQEQVHDAIKTDFNIDERDIKHGANDQEKTNYLAVQVPNLVPDSGISIVTYIFGYSTKKLIQVNVVWGKPTGQSSQPGELVTTGKLLQKYFLEQGFAHDTLIVNRTTNTGSVVLFNGYDDRKRSVLLMLDTMAVPVAGSTPPSPAPPPAKGKPDAKAPPKPADTKKPAEMQLVASALRLSYIEDAVNPDVFRIQRGKF
jgi:hypothetical protein